MNHAARRQELHPVAWWLWALLVAAAASRTTNPLLLLLMIVVLGVVVAARRSDAPWSRSYGAFLKLAAVVLAIRTTFHVVLGGGVGTTVLVTLPEVQLGDWAQGIRLGGPVTAEGVVAAMSDALRLATMLVCVGAANALASPRRLLRALPAALYEVSVAVVVALSVAPQLVEHATAVRRARALRGEEVRGLRSVRRVLVPVLEGALDRSLQLAASMDARGYGRTNDVSPAARRLTGALVVGGLLALAVGSYGLLGEETPARTSWTLLLVGVGLAVAALRVGARRVQRTQHRPDRWRASEAMVVLSGAGALLGVIAAGAIDGASLVVPVAPLSLPGLPPVAVLGALGALAPALAAPDPRHATPGESATAAPAPPRLTVGEAAA